MPPFVIPPPGGGGPAPDPLPPEHSGGLYGAATRDYRLPPGVIPTTFTTRTFSTRRPSWQPFYVTTPITFDRMAVEISTAASSGVFARLGVYTGDEFWQPEDLVLDAGTVPVDDTTFEAITVDLTLQPGRYVGVYVASDVSQIRTCLATPPWGVSFNDGTYVGSNTSFRSISTLTSISSTFVDTGFPATLSQGWERDLLAATPTNNYPIRWREAA